MPQAVLRVFVLILVTTFFTTSAMVPAAKSATIDTTTYINLTENTTKSQLEKLFDREDVREQLVAMGVDPDEATKRLDSLTVEEMAMLQNHLDNLPAGANVFVVLGVVLVVLIVLELLGVTNVFTRL